jgi:hypothetical protein
MRESIRTLIQNAPPPKNKGGRPRGSISKKRLQAQDILSQLEAELGREVNPLEGLLRIGSDTKQPLSIRVQCMTEALPYLYPKLQSQAVAVTHDESPVNNTVDMTVLLSTPDAVEAVQKLALLMAVPDNPPVDTMAQICGPDDSPRPMEQSADDIQDRIMGTLERDNAGHWK